MRTKQSLFLDVTQLRRTSRGRALSLALVLLVFSTLFFRSSEAHARGESALGAKIAEITGRPE